MGCRWYLAMTASEMHGYMGSKKIAWMSCHFSAYSTGLSNLPIYLPPDSLVILDDRNPLSDHDPQRIAAQLSGIENMAGLLLDLQQPSNGILDMIHYLHKALSCPVAVTETYAKDTECAVFVSAPLNLPLEDTIKPWQGRQIWLDIPFGMQTFTITKSGCDISPIQPWDDQPFPHREDSLSCSYRMQKASDHICFTLCRKPETITNILSQADALNIPCAISLYQEYLRK